MGRFLLALAASLVVPLGYAVLTGDNGTGPLLIAAAASAAAGAIALLLSGRPDNDLTIREAFLLVCLIWFCVSFFGSLPFFFSPHFVSFTDAFFESASGFTTTGATVLANVEILPDSIQLWRHFTHWLGGMGVVLLGLAILPLVGPGGMQLYRAEFSGSRSEKLKPRIRETVLALWKVYLALTIAAIIALRVAGMSMFDAVCHSFSTLGTGGFSTRTASIAAYNSAVIEYIIIVFMLLSGVSFAQHYRLWVERRLRPVISDFEVQWYFAIAAFATVIVSATLLLTTDFRFEAAVRTALFQVSSIMTTTGFVTSDFEFWHPLPQLILLALMFVGGSTGSTAGGLKTSRIALLAHVVSREFKRMVERRAVFAIRIGGHVIEDQTIHGLLNLIYLAFVVNFTACLLLAAVGIDVLSSITAVASCMFNIGPGLGSVGPIDNYGHLPTLAKWVLSIVMIAGRLEFYTLLVIVTPAFWRR